MMMADAVTARAATVALVGNPNSGKTTLFNSLTGLRQKVANYPGVTVEKKEGFFTLPASEKIIAALDLPGAYSLLTRSPDEEIVHRVISGRQAGTPVPDLLVIVVDAFNLERNLFFVTQLLETGIPCVLALNMWDMVAQGGTVIDLAKLGQSLKVPIVPTVGRRRQGIQELKGVIEKQLSGGVKQGENGFHIDLPASVETEILRIQQMIDGHVHFPPSGLRAEALRLLGDSQFRSSLFQEVPALRQTEVSARANLTEDKLDSASVEAETRYAYVQNLCRQVIRQPAKASASLSEKLDGILTHKVWGFAVFFALMALVFQSIFTWASAPMDAISALVDGLSGWAAAHLPEGQLNSLIVDGVIAGVGSVVIFLPQILFLFFFIALFEDSGYMARAAFVLDRVMRKVGLSGKSFIPLLSSFACAVPAIMSTRTIEDKNDRLATIMVAPLMSCSARLPVYALMISAFIPSLPVLGIFDLQGVTLFSMYALSLLAGLGMAAIFRKTLLKGYQTPFVLELPPYRIPNLRTVLMTMWEKAGQFLYRAGTIIFTLSIILWFLASYPRHQAVETKFEQMKTAAAATYSGADLDARMTEIEGLHKSEQMRGSFAGKLGQWIEPVIRPLGYDWKIGIGLIASFAAREVLVSTLAIVYGVGESDNTDANLAKRLQRETSPVTGLPVYSPLVAVSIMVFFVLACQCMSTVAVVKRETNSWRWPLFMIAYMTALAWTGAFAVYQGGRFLGF